MTEETNAPSLANPLDVVPNDETLGDVTAGDASRPRGEVNAFTDEEADVTEGAGRPNGDARDGKLGEDAASDHLAHLQDGELVTEQETTVDTPDDLGGTAGPQAGGAG